MGADRKFNGAGGEPSPQSEKEQTGETRRLQSLLHQTENGDQSTVDGAEGCVLHKKMNLPTSYKKIGRSMI